VPERLRDVALSRFRDDPKANPFVGQPSAGGQGLDLSTADAVIWYSSVQDAITTAQADERATAKGGRTVALVTLATPGTVDDDIRASNKDKARLADTISGAGLRDLLSRLQG
jgi:SNF2 family DNA or RNA helicase